MDVDRVLWVETHIIDPAYLSIWLTDWLTLYLACAIGMMAWLTIKSKGHCSPHWSVHAITHTKISRASDFVQQNFFKASEIVDIDWECVCPRSLEINVGAVVSSSRWSVQQRRTSSLSLTNALITLPFGFQLFYATWLFQFICGQL